MIGCFHYLMINPRNIHRLFSNQSKSNFVFSKASSRYIQEEVVLVSTKKKKKGNTLPESVRNAPNLVIQIGI